MKIQFGCGSNRLDGWDNHDYDIDITKPLPFPDSCAEEILCEHCCEHVSTPDFFRFVEECHRVLRNGGNLWLALPVLDRLDKPHARDIILGHGHLAAYTSDSLRFVLAASSFRIGHRLSDRPEIFGHWRVIGAEKDDTESCRYQLVK